MSTMPDPTPGDDHDVRAGDPWTAGEETESDSASVPQEPEPEASTGVASSPVSEKSFLETYGQTSYGHAPPRPPRFPNVGDVLVMLFLLGLGWLISGAFTYEALHYHVFDVFSQKQAMNDVRYTLGAQVVWYLITLSFWVLVFPRIWGMGFWKGVEWRGRAALQLRWQLASSAFACFVLAIVDGIVLPGPKEAPIDQVFRIPGAAWALFGFGVTLAPLIEETIFRGFLLPALCTAWAWSMEHIHHQPGPWPDARGKTEWTLPAMVVGSVLTSIPFALMHGYQTGYSLGPFVLLVCVSLVLCWVRLSTRSVAASTVVHACYNLLLFALMILGTSGFRHMEKL